MKGYPLSIYTLEVSKTGNSGSLAPAEIVNDFEQKWLDLKGKYFELTGRELSCKRVNNVPMRLLKMVFTQEEIIKLNYQTVTTMHQTVQDVHDTHYQYEIFRKLRSSAWRWGCGHLEWDYAVDAYNALRGFRVNLPDFEVRLDYTTYSNERGYSKFSRTFLDGVFAYLIYYRGKHVMTVGFSLASRGRVLINQIQLVKKKGNRFLYKMPCDHVSFMVECFVKTFSTMNVYLVNGTDLAEVIRSECQKNFDFYQKDYKKEKETLSCLINSSQADEENIKLHRRWAARSLADFRAWGRKLKEFDRFTFRHIEKTYQFNTSKIIRRGRPTSVGQMRFHPLRLAA